MKKSHWLCTIALMASSISQTAYAQTDITSQYLKNPSFEQDAVGSLSAVNNSADGLRGYTLNQPTGWTKTGSDVTNLAVTAACYTDNNFGKVTSLSDGTQAYYMRMGWSTGSTQLKQSVSLPAGKYRFAVDHRSGYANGATSSLKLSAATENTSLTFSPGSAGCFTTMAWETAVVDFTLSQKTSVDLSFTIDWKSGGSCIMLDNCRLYDMSSYVEPKDPTENEVTSPTEGVISNTFVGEEQMMTDLLKMLAKFATYLKNDYQACTAPNSVGEACGCFKGESTMANNEAGVRTNADLSMICAFLVKYAKPAGIELPAGVTYADLEDLAMKTLVFAYSTHKANKLKVCSGNNYWGSTSTSDAVWESSLWAMSVAYSAYFQWDKLTEAQKGYIYAMLKAECNYELGRSIPTGYSGDTKAEENGWEADVLAVTLGLFPDDPLAPQWYERMREFAVNSYSHYSDASNTAPLDPDYNSKSVADLYKGNNLYSDYSLQNHNLFHTSYQNVVMQELGEAALALKMFQLGLKGEEKWKSNALMHNNQEVMDNIMNWLALADGELAMPNGNDWSLFLYDQITSYSTQATFQRDANALLLENLAYKQIMARQTTTADGSWLLRPDVQARRMGVEAHRVMMTYLMHLTNSTASLTPTSWDDFRNTHSEARLLPCQNVVRAYTKDRFTTFSWSTGLKSYTGYFASDKADKNKIVVPYRANNSGNLTGWYEVSGKGTNAEPVVSGVYQLNGNAWVMNGELAVNDKALNNRFALYSTPGNALIYLDYVTANTACTITAEKGGLLAISTDELTKLKRTLYYNKGDEISWKQTDGASQFTFASDWTNIDNELGIVSLGNGKKMAFADRGANNSIYTSKLYPMYSNTSRSVSSGAVVDARNLVYYSSVDAETTQALGALLQKPTVPTGWNAVIAADPDGTHYLLLGNFKGSSTTATLSDITCPKGAPVFSTETTIASDKASATFKAQQNNAVGNALKVFVKGFTGKAVQLSGNDEAVYLSASSAATSTAVTIITDGKAYTGTKALAADQCVKAYVAGGKVVFEAAKFPASVATAQDLIVNPSFDGNTSQGWTGTVACSYNVAERYNATLDIHQTITGLTPGKYKLACQGFYRDGSSATAASNYKAGTYKANAQLYATSGGKTFTEPLPSIASEAGKMGTLGTSTSLGYVPNNMEQTSQYFQAGLYPCGMIVEVGADGELTIGIRKSSTISTDWAIFDNFSLCLISMADLTEEIDALHNGNPRNLALSYSNTRNIALHDYNADGKLTLDDVHEIVNILLEQ